MLVNTDIERAHDLVLTEEDYGALGTPRFDLLDQSPPPAERIGTDKISFRLAPEAAFCLSAFLQPQGLAGDAYRHARACASFAFRALAQVLPMEQLGACRWRILADAVDKNPFDFLAALPHLDIELASSNLSAAVMAVTARLRYPQVVVWRLSDATRVLLVPPRHCLLIEDTVAFRVSLTIVGSERATHEHSISVQGRHVACFAPQATSGDARLFIERYGPDPPQIEAAIRFLPPEQIAILREFVSGADAPVSRRETLWPTSILDCGLVLLTNGRGGMARLCVNLGQVKSKYDCALAANLHASVPVDRHIFVKRLRVWSVADGFITPLDDQNLFTFDPGPPARCPAHTRRCAGQGSGRARERRAA